MDKRIDFKRFGACMAALQEWAGLPASGSRTELYWRALEDMPIEQVERAAWDLIKNRMTASFPKPGELRESVFGKAEDHASLAVAKIETAWRNGIDSGCNVSFGDSALHYCIENAGGWIYLCGLPTEQWHFVRKDIEKAYKALHGKQVEAPEILWGVHGSIENRQQLESRGIKPKIYYIGQSEVKQMSYEPAKQIENESTAPEVMALVGKIGG